jgi:hypothetical protein
MSLSDLASVGSFVSGVAVLASLVFLYFQVRQVNQQVRQAEKNQKALVMQARTALLAEVPLRLAESDMATTFVKGQRGEHLSLVEFYQFRWANRALLSNAQQSFYQHESRLLDDAVFKTLTLALSREYSAPGRRAMWRLERGRYEEGFRAFIDEAVREALPWVSDELTDWQSALAAETAGA